MIRSLIALCQFAAGVGSGLFFSFDLPLGGTTPRQSVLSLLLIAMSVPLLVWFAGHCVEAGTSGKFDWSFRTLIGAVVAVPFGYAAAYGLAHLLVALDLPSRFGFVRYEHIGVLFKYPNVMLGPPLTLAAIAGYWLFRPGAPEKERRFVLGARVLAVVWFLALFLIGRMF